MLQYVSIKDKYRVNVIKYITIVNAGNFQSGNIVVSNDKDRQWQQLLSFIYTLEGSDKVADGS